MVLKTPESPLDCKETQPVHPKGDQSGIFIGRTDAEAETPILWPPDAKSWLIGKDPDVGKDWRQEEKGTTEDETVGWHRRLSGHGFEWTPAVGDGQGGLACCSPLGHKESDTADGLNCTEEWSSLRHLTRKTPEDWGSPGLRRPQRCWHGARVRCREKGVLSGLCCDATALNLLPFA